MAEPAVLLLASLAVLAAAFVQGVTGFGHALLAIGALMHLLGPREAVLVLSLLAPPIAIAVFLKLRASVEWRETLAIALPLCLAGMPLGVWLFSIIDQTLLKRGVGVLLIVVAVFFLTPWAPREAPRPRWMAVATGFVSGFLNGVASTGGPPLVLYLWARDLGKDVRMAVLQAVFTCGSLAKIVVLEGSGPLHLLRIPRPLGGSIPRRSSDFIPGMAKYLPGQCSHRHSGRAHDSLYPLPQNCSPPEKQALLSRLHPQRACAC